MTVVEVKTKIHRVVDELPESILQGVLDYLNLVQHQSVENINLNNNLKKILEEDKELFERLAQ